MKVSVVVPCYGSEGTVGTLVDRLAAELPRVCEAAEVILVVDGSPDSTADVARAGAMRHPEMVRVLVLRRNYGQHNALLAGISRARHEVIVTMDDDLQHRPDTIASLLEPLDDPAVDLVYGVAQVEEHGFVRSAASRLVKSGLALTGVPSARDVSAFRAFRADLREGFQHVADPHFSLDVVLNWTTTAIRRVSVPMDERAVGRSNYTLGALLRHTFNMVTGYGTLPLRLVSFLGLGTSVFGFGLLIWVLASYLRGGIEVAGFTTLAAMLALLSGAMMLSIGVLGEYLGRLHFRSMQKPPYLVRSDTAGPDPSRPAEPDRLPD